MTFSGGSNFALDIDLGKTLNINPVKTPNFVQKAFSPALDIGSFGFTGGFDFGTDFGIPKLNVPDYSDIFKTQQQTNGFLGDVLKGIFELPSILSIGKGIMDATTSTAAFKNAAAEAERANAAAQQEYWARYADQVAQNYRDYQQQLDTYYRDMDYVQRRRDYEAQLEKQQAEFVGATGVQAFKNFERQIADLEGRFYEEEAKETIEIENIRAQSIAAAGKVQAKGQAGRSVERMTNQYHQQYLANVSNREITRNYRIADKIRQGEALDVARQNTVNQLQFYTPQPISDPVKPLAPLPITAVPPTPVSGPSKTAFTIDLANIGLEALKNYESMQPPKPTPEK
jgi:hypothetical protein